MAAGKIQMDYRTKLSDIEKYNPIENDPRTVAWLKQMKEQDKIIDGTVPLIEVAKSMIYYSSNSNTEYLQDLVGLDNINAGLRQMGIIDYDSTFYLISEYYLFKNDEKLPHDEYIKKIKSFTKEYIRTESTKIHEILKNDETGQYKKTILPYMTAEIDKLVTDTLASASTNALVKIVELVNSKKYFSDKEHQILDSILEVQSNIPPKSKILYQYYGEKSGGMNTLLVNKGYSTDRTGIKKEYALIINDIPYQEDWAPMSEIVTHFFPFLYELSMNHYFSNIVCKSFE